MFKENTLIPAIVQDFYTKEVLMLAYMNEESLRLTKETKTTWFYSRSRKELWNKGATSGNYQTVINIKYDCDEDTFLISVIPKGPSCHTNNYSCFYRTLLEGPEQTSFKALLDLENTIADRKDNPKEGSYTNYLFNNGIDKILKKIGEESAEIIIAAKNNSKQEVIYETSDFIYHMMVMLKEMGIPFSDILKNLSKRAE
ncbi:MAG: bifunctional phosphoribosyl-AMP cyclohydrolase/phosphoribosyl-ATP pyrophosphatase [Alkaliphilus sp.]|nr:bifunctional phosphoribosyl-AMP cyclohydrolase/phosphoribosyl-ATP diphosphatase HisIE [bacterium AH-315-L21]MBN4069273.1 bifunctional phosphoribosyl-AMP cyclohydrolase/phosphoribosyl-ATP diphosphatase HisIE [bacterium AH-315-G05]PHS34860.1 MAG: bifunctional phosphoribosyl-AMP cyclohydrolase/phosphoribosyl-ATP pyrophosphatase [Alkaliphilus sp.]